MPFSPSETYTMMNYGFNVFHDFLRLIISCHTLFGHIIEEIRCLSSSLVRSCFKYTSREGNNLAHALSRRAVLSADTDVWIEELSNNLDDVFQLNLIQ